MWEWADWGADKWGSLWNMWWVTQGKEGEEPPEDVKNFYQMVDDIRALPLRDAQKKADEISANMKENLWYFISTQDVSQPVCINAKIGNFSGKGFAIAQNFAGEQWFFKK